MPFELRTGVGSVNPVLDEGPDRPWEWAILKGVKGRPIVKYRDILRSSVQKRLNGWMDGLRCHLVWRKTSSQATVLYGVPAAPSPKGGEPQIFGPCPVWQNGWMDQDVLDWDPAPLLPNFRPISVVPKRLDASRCHSVWR